MAGNRGARGMQDGACHFWGARAVVRRVWAFGVESCCNTAIDQVVVLDMTDALARRRGA